MIEMTRLQELRIKNLKLFLEMPGIKATEIAKKARTSKAYLSQLKNKTPSSTGAIRNLTDDMARRVERAAGLAEGWFDVDHDKEEPTIVMNKNIFERVIKASRAPDFANEDDRTVTLAIMSLYEKLADEENTTDETIQYMFRVELKQYR